MQNLTNNQKLDGSGIRKKFVLDPGVYKHRILSSSGLRNCKKCFQTLSTRDKMIDFFF
jgi:hypothetical protein